jgi:hypothetical protein
MGSSSQFFAVMAGLDPAIHANRSAIWEVSVDARNKSGNDDRGEARGEKALVVRRVQRRGVDHPLDPAHQPHASMHAFNFEQPWLLMSAFGQG